MIKIRFIASDIRFWIFLYFLIRLFGITNAPLEATHNWRQSTVNTIARNFEEIDNNILYPRFDTAGEKSGVSGTEFPVFNYLIYAANGLFGYSHWYGRLINLIISSLGVFVFYLIVKDWSTERHAFFSTLVLLGSLWFTYSRKIMPDTLSISLCLMGLWFATRFLQNGKVLYLLYYVLLSTLGGLAKIPALVVLVPLVLIVLSEWKERNRNMSLIAISVIPLTLIGIWYFYWFPKLSQDYQLYSLGPGISKGFLDLAARPQETLENFYFDALKYSGFMLYLWGLYLIVRHRNREFLIVFMVSAVAFFVFMMQAGFGFSIHGYYVLPFIPIMAFVAGYGLEHIQNQKMAIFIVGIFLVEGLANLQHDFFVRDNQKYKLYIEQTIESVIPSNALIAVNGGPNPQLMYFAHRRGWTMKSERLMDQKTLNGLMSLGAKYLLWDKHQSHLVPDLTPIFEDEHLMVFEFSHGNTQ